MAIRSTITLFCLLSILITTTCAQMQFIQFQPFPPAASFHTFQLAPLGAFPTPTSIPTATTSPVQTGIAATPVPADRVSRLVEPNVFNDGTSSDGLSQALKFFMDEEFRIATEHIALSKEQQLISGSPRSLSDPGILSRSRVISALEGGIQSSASRNAQDAATFSPQSFKFNVLSTTPLDSVTPAASSTPPGLDDLPSPTLLMNPTVQGQVQEGLRNFTDIFADLKSVFSPSPSTTSTINTILKEAPSASEVSSVIRSTPKPSSSSSSSSSPPPLLNIGSLGSALGGGGSRSGGLGGLGSIFDLL